MGKITRVQVMDSSKDEIWELIQNRELEKSEEYADLWKAVKDDLKAQEFRRQHMVHEVGKAYLNGINEGQDRMREVAEEMGQEDLAEAMYNRKYGITQKPDPK